MLNFLNGKKTFIAAWAMIGVCGLELAGVDVVGSIDPANAPNHIWEAIVFIFLRGGIAKV